MAEPKIRFKRDDGSSYPEWTQTVLSDLFQRVNERNNGQFDKTKWISVAKMYYQEPEKVQSNNINTRTYVMRYGDIAFEGHPNADFLYGRFVVNDIGDGVISELFPIYRHKKPYIIQYWKYAIQVEKIMAPVYRHAITSSGASSNKLKEEDFLRQRIPVPCCEEQQKIADFLSSVDEVIAASEQEVANLETQKKALMKKIFSQEVRFKKEDGTGFPEWEEIKLGSFAKRVTRKNKDNACKLPLTISAEHGLIDQGEFFNKTVASKDMSTYYLLQNGEFAFNKSTSKDYPVGAIKRLDRYDVGAVSPLYICFELFGDAVLSDFVVQYFETDCWHQGVLDIAQEGARTHGLLNISVSGFFETVHELPSDVEEQRLIAGFLSNFDEAISAAKKELDLWKQLKKGLLQQLFV